MLMSQMNALIKEYVDENIHDMHTNCLLKQYEIEKILQQILKPENNFQYPISVNCKNNLVFQYSCFENFELHLIKY